MSLSLYASDFGRRPNYWELLKQAGVFRFGDVVLRSGQRSTWYAEMRHAYEDPMTLMELANGLAKLCVGLSLDGIVGVATGGIAPTLGTALLLNLLEIRDPEKHVKGFWADKKREGTGFEFNAFTIIPGARYAVLEDVTTTGNSSKGPIELIRAAGGEVVLVVVILNRGGVTAEALGVPEVRSLISELPPEFAETSSLAN